MEEQGHIPEDEFNAMGIVRDKDRHGNEQLRSAGISQENFQRSKCLTHEFQVDLRKQRREQLRLKQEQKMQRANDKHLEKVNANREVIDKLCRKLCAAGLIDGDEETCTCDEELVAQCTVEMFGELNRDELAAFILARDTTATSKSSLPNKGTVAEAKRGFPNRILRAFECRDKPNFIEGALPHDLSSLDDNEEDVSAFNAYVLTLGSDDDITPAELLGNHS